MSQILVAVMFSTGWDIRSRLAAMPIVHNIRDWLGHSQVITRNSRKETPLYIFLYHLPSHTFHPDPISKNVHPIKNNLQLLSLPPNTPHTLSPIPTKRRILHQARTRGHPRLPRLRTLQNRGRRGRRNM